MKKTLSTFEATCFVAGAGIGGGVMAVPYLAQQAGILPTIIIAVVAYLVTLVLHIMVAELSVRTDYSSELLTIFSKHLFKNKNFLKSGFYILMAITLTFNLAAYITGSGEILSELIGIPHVIGKMTFFIIAATVVFLGLKRIAVNEIVALTIKITFLITMAILTFISPGNISFIAPPIDAMIAVYGMIMFSLSSLFAVAQVTSGLGENSKKEVIKAVSLGLLINLIVIIIITVSVIYSSDPVTEVAIVGWAKALGPIVNVLGSLFIFFAMLGAFWSISLQLCDMTEAFFKTGHRLSWLFGTMPCFIVALLPMAGFLDLMQIAGGATAIIVALMVVPAYRNSIQTCSQNYILLGSLGKKKTVAITIILMYILMTVASFL